MTNSYWSCSNCGTENPYSNFRCWKCSKGLKPEKNKDNNISKNDETRNSQMPLLIFITLSLLFGGAAIFHLKFSRDASDSSKVLKEPLKDEKIERFVEQRKAITKLIDLYKINRVDSIFLVPQRFKVWGESYPGFTFFLNKENKVEDIRLNKDDTFSFKTILRGKTLQVKVVIKLEELLYLSIKEPGKTLSQVYPKPNNSSDIVVRHKDLVRDSENKEKALLNVIYLSNNNPKMSFTFTMNKFLSSGKVLSNSNVSLEKNYYENLKYNSQGFLSFNLIKKGNKHSRKEIKLFLEDILVIRAKSENGSETYLYPKMTDFGDYAIKQVEKEDSTQGLLIKEKDKQDSSEGKSKNTAEKQYEPKFEPLVKALNLMTKHIEAEIDTVFNLSLKGYSIEGVRYERLFLSMGFDHSHSHKIDNKGILSCKALFKPSKLKKINLQNRIPDFMGYIEVPLHIYPEDIISITGKRYNGEKIYLFPEIEEENKTKEPESADLFSKESNTLKKIPLLRRHFYQAFKENNKKLAIKLGLELYNALERNKNHHWTYDVIIKLGVIYEDLDSLQEYESLLQRTITHITKEEKKSYFDYYYLAKYMILMGHLEASQFSFIGAEKYFKKALETFEKLFDEESHELLEPLRGIADSMEQQSRFEEAKSIHERVELLNQKLLDK